MTRDRYKTRLAKFLDFIEMVYGSKSLEDKARMFAKKRVILIGLSQIY